MASSLRNAPDLVNILRANARHGYPYSLLAKPRLSGSQFVFPIPDGAVHECLGPSKRRRVVIFSEWPGGGVVQISPNQFNPGDQIGFSLTATSPPFIFRYEDFGSLVQGSWFVSTNAGASFLTVTECFEDYDD